MSIIDQIPEMTDDQLKVVRKNATEKLDDPKRHDEASEVLDAIDRQLELRHIPGMITTFKEQYPGGFYGEQQALDERDYKERAATEFQELLGRSEFEALLHAGEYQTLYDRAARLVGLTNFIQGSFEKPVLLDAIKANSDQYMTALYEFIWGAEDLEPRFNEFMRFSESVGLAKWTYVTYFLFLSDPDKHMFVKPEMLKRSLEISQYPLEYEPTPSYDQYRQILDFSQWLKTRIAELEPRDMIDVHSFMWHMAPTGNGANEMTAFGSDI